jgi:hypothetical protein
VIGIDIGKNSFHVAGHNARGAIVPRQKWSRSAREKKRCVTCAAWKGSLFLRMLSSSYATLELIHRAPKM